MVEKLKLGTDTSRLFFDPVPLFGREVEIGDQDQELVLFSVQKFVLFDLFDDLFKASLDLWPIVGVIAFDRVKTSGCEILAAIAIQIDMGEVIDALHQRISLSVKLSRKSSILV